MNLRDYEQHKFAIAEILRSASTLACRDDRLWHERVQDLFARLAEDRFNLVVVGRFNRGKTSLMNAIMGTGRLPTGILPLTSVITTVGYGSREQAILSYEGRILTPEIPIDDLPRYVTQEGNPGNVQRIKKAEIQLPAEILRRGFHFVDTPGLGSAIAENTRTTEAYLPEADAFLLVTSYESPLSEEEMRLFRVASPSARRIFVVLNKHDMVSAEERRTALVYVREQLSAIFGPDNPRVFSISARDGLDAKRLKDAVRLDESGLPALESELVDFLLSDKSTEFLLGMCARVASLLRDQPSSSALTELVEKIGALAEAISEESPGKHLPRRSLVSIPVGSEAAPRLRSCEICACVNDALWDFLCRFQYDLSIDHEEQQRFAERGGLCSFHTWQYEAIASPQGTCTGFPPLLDHLAVQLREMVSASGLLPEIEDLASNPGGCAMCAAHARAETAAISATAGRLSKDRRILSTLSAICLPHLAKLTAAIEDHDLIRELIEREAMILERLSEDMKRYALKRDAVRRYLLTEEETAAAHEALSLLAGHRNVNAMGYANTVRNAPAAAPPSDGTSGDGFGRSASAPGLVDADPP
jgi:GTP-binding protein EngB required for normal cell division